MMSRTGENRKANHAGRASRPGLPADEERARIRALVVESRRRQGLPPTIEDPVFLSRIAAILLDPEPTPLPGEPEVPE